MLTSSAEEELRDIWKQAVENVEEDANNYFYERNVRIHGIDVSFDVDTDEAVYYATKNGVMDDLVFAKKSAEGRNDAEVMESADEFVERVSSVVNDWADRNFR